MKLCINPQNSFQLYKGIGASGAWWAQEVGGWTNIDSVSGIAVRDRIAQLLYSKTEGIGLHTYRYNIGAGSKDSGKGNIDNPLRRTESFDCGKGKYDFIKDSNAVYMMEQAVKEGAEEVILFVNSPIERLTKNGWSHLGKYQIMRDNIKPRNYNNFADYCLDVTEHFVNKGLPVKYLSPVNEPVWIWNGGQEGCHYSPWSAARVMKSFAEKLLTRPALHNVKLSGVESGDLRWFNKTYTRLLLKYGVVRRCIDAVDVHSYCLPLPIPFWDFNNRVAFVKRYRKWLDKNYPDLEVKMSEWCHMQGGRDKSMKSALVTANVMYEDFTLLNVTSWQHWIAVSEVDYCDGLIYINLDDKSFEMTKRYYVTGNFSKYIPIGARRVEAFLDDEGLKVLCYVKDNKAYSVVINDSCDSVEVDLPASGGVLHIITDDNNDLAEKQVMGNSVTVSPQSVNTLIFDI